MDLKTKYMGMELKSPLVPSASPLSADLDTARALEDNGAAAIVMYSLFEEQIRHEARELDHYLTTFSESYSEALSYFPEPESFPNLEAEGYLTQIQRLKKTLEIPVIASLNGVSAGGWMNFAKEIEAAGADALELNIYFLPTDPLLTSQEVENIYIEDVRRVKDTVSIPVAIKLSPYFSAFANMALRLDQAGADALVLFNRFYQPDIDLENLEIQPNLVLSNSNEIRLPLRWIAILTGMVNADLAATSGVHSAEDVIKLIMSGATITQMASVLLKEGPQAIRRVETDLLDWMEAHEYESIDVMRGSMSYQAVAESAALIRANYIKTLHSIR
ncbi:MAG TPA: dihydroorotate dehydrogenase-like protein [Calditrichia bacterium]|nr:dihydroorotate dehydrogenase-like protein [Calditrichota bacterium]HQU72060.1 dihydroorotate dehydrogenase-like protein [Calditrichia bacterium]HQV31543.1 dihydroorotate dehydrogenase-like protein [Calditrichia bacterium]